MKFVILTGMSGSGKTNALKILEDIGYYFEKEKLCCILKRQRRYYFYTWDNASS